MNLLYIFYTISVVTARKSKKGVSRDDDTPESSRYNYTHVDMKGNFKQMFFLFSALATPEDNTVCSPLSAFLPLGKLALGADGRALKELLAAIGVKKKSKIRHEFKPLLIELRYLPGGKLDIASRLYLSVNTHLQRTFVDQSRDIFDSSVEKIDFQYPKYAAEQINAWVSSQTNYVIKDIVAPSDILSSMTSLILVNAVYFSGIWNEAFDKLQNHTFHSTKGTKSVPMMTRISYYNYTKSEALSSQIIQIPYKGEKASFVIVLPTLRNGLSILLRQLKLAPELLDSAMSKLAETRVELTMPKFEIETKLNLNELYEKVGVKQIFRKNDSGLTKIIRDGSIYVTVSKQKAYVEVNQFGTEAGAASLTHIAKLAYVKPETFLADHPFLFFILVKKQQLFSGTLVNPD